MLSISCLGTSVEFFLTMPFAMHSQLAIMWDRLVESGLNQHIERLTLEVFKTSRQEWIQTRLSEIHNDESVLKPYFHLSSTEIIYLLVLGFGYTIAGLTLFVEMILHK